MPLERAIDLALQSAGHQQERHRPAEPGHALSPEAWATRRRFVHSISRRGPASSCDGLEGQKRTLSLLTGKGDLLPKPPSRVLSSVSPVVSSLHGCRYWV